MKTVADQFAETLATAGVKRIYGIVGDSPNGLTDLLHRHGEIEWVHVRDEEVAAFATGAEAHLTGELAVCAGSWGPGYLHLDPHHSVSLMSSLSANDVGQNSNYPLDPAHSVPVMSSPSAHGVGSNSNYPLDPKHMVAIDNSSVVMPNNDGPVQSANSLPQPIDTTTQFAGHRTPKG